MTQPSHCFEIVTDRSALRALKGDWDDLYDRQDSPHLSDSFEWAWLSWDAVTSHPRRRACCVVMRRAERTVAIWPLVVTATPLLAAASPLNSESSEYCPCLLDPEEPPGDIWRALRDELRNRGGVDVLRLPHVRQDTRLHELVSEEPEARATIVQPAPMVRADSLADRQVAGLPPGKTANLRRRRRRLEAMGRVTFHDVASAEERTEILHWVLARKREWLGRRGLSNAGLLSKTNAGFLAATLRHEWTTGSRRVFALKLEGAVIAAEIASVDGRRVESFTTTFDRAFEKCSPGHLLTLEVIRWALARGLDYDFRPGREPYKLEWSNHVTPVTSYLLPLTFRGRLFVRYRLGRRWLSERTPDDLRKRIRRVGARLRGAR